MLTCPKCGFDNELGRIFCHQCGAKLDLDQIKSPAQGGPKIRRRGAWTWRRVARRALDVAVIAFLVWVIYLLCQVPEVRPFKPTNADLLAADNKRLQLDEIMLQQKPAFLEVSEEELNTFIGSLGFNKPRGTGFEVVPVTLRTKLDDGVVELIFVGEVRIGSAFSKKIYVSYTGAPVIDDGQFEFRPVSACVGRMPIHPRLLQTTGLIQDSFARLLDKFDHERDLLDKLNSISVKPGKVVLSYRPPERPVTVGGNVSKH